MNDYIFELNGKCFLSEKKGSPEIEEKKKSFLIVRRRLIKKESKACPFGPWVD